MNTRSVPRAAHRALVFVISALMLVAAGSAALAAPAPLVTWAQRAGGTGSDVADAQGIAALPDGSSIVTGYFSGTATFGGTTLTSSGADDMFTAKLNADGTWGWATRAGGTGNDRGHNVSALPDGSSMVTGYFTGTAAFGGTTLPSSGQYDLFAAKLNADGTWAWATSAGGTGTAGAAGYGVPALADGSSIVGGYFTGTTAFGGVSLTSAGSADAFAARLNADGTWGWATRAGGTTASDEVYSWGITALPDGSSIVAGPFAGTATFGGTTLTSSGRYDLFVAKLNPNGAWAWATRAGGTGGDAAFGWGIAALPDGSPIVTGYFNGTAAFGGTTLTSSGADDMFTAKLSADGTWAWATRAGGTENDRGFSISALPDGSSVVTGYFRGATAFGGTTVTSSGGDDMFTAKLNTDGTWAWATRAGGAGDDNGFSVSGLPDGSSTVTGSFTGTAGFGGTTLAASGARDVVAVRYLDAPQAPTAPRAAAGDQRASVSITPLAGGSITSYLVTASQGGRTCTITPPATGCRVTGLANGTRYAFTTTATNAAGTSPSSPASNVVSPTATLRATLLPSRRTVASGQRMRIAIRIANADADQATAARACIVLPANLVVVRARPTVRSGHTLCFDLGSIAAGGQATRTITVRGASVRRVTRTVRGTARARERTRVAAPGKAVTIVPRPARARVTG